MSCIPQTLGKRLRVSAAKACRSWPVPKVNFRLTGERIGFAIGGDSGKRADPPPLPTQRQLALEDAEVAAQMVTIYVGSLVDPPEFAPTYGAIRREPSRHGAAPQSPSTRRFM
jgi:hypothetical protein